MINEIIGKYGQQLILLVLSILFGALGIMMRNFCKRFLDTEEKRQVARLAAQYAEQVFKDLHGEDKMRMALKAAAEYLERKGILYNEEELRFLIEAAVGEFNNAFAVNYLDYGEVVTNPPEMPPDSVSVEEGSAM